MRTLEDVVEELKRDPSHPVSLKVGDLTIEVRAVRTPSPEGTAADVFAGLGAWDGETTEEILAILAEARQRGGTRSVPDL